MGRLELQARKIRVATWTSGEATFDEALVKRDEYVKLRKAKYRRRYGATVSTRPFQG
jgi:hypothetical protein